MSYAGQSWRVAQLAGGLGTIGLATDSVVGTPAGPTRVQLAAIPICALLWGIALIARRSRSVVLANATFLLIIAVIATSLVSSTQHIAESGISWVPFRANQLGALAIAILAPPVAWVGIVAIVAMIGAAVLQFALFDPTIRASMPFGDPWSTLFFGVFAIVLLFYRRRADQTAQECVRAQAESESYQHYARNMLALRDLANSPLQIMLNVVTLLRARGPELAEHADQLERAIKRLTSLERAVRPLERSLRWRPGDESWDPKAQLGLEASPPR